MSPLVLTVFPGFILGAVALGLWQSRAGVAFFAIVACLIAPSLGRPELRGIFTFIQEFQGFISPGILAVCLFGLVVPRAPRFLGRLGIALNAVLYVRSRNFSMSPSSPAWRSALEPRW